MLLSAPLEVARTNAWTSASRATSASVRCDPMKPSAPVTRQVRPAKTSPYSCRSALSASSVQVESEGSGFITRMEAVEETKPSPLPGRSALRSGVATGLSFLALAGSGALAGVYLAHKFGRNERTDGFMGAYGVYLVLVLGAQAFRMVVVPDLTRAELDIRRRLFTLAQGGAVPIAIQGLYVIALRFAAGTGAGNVTSLSYAYLLAAMFVSATAFSLSLISAAPLTRRGVDAETAADHLVHSAWVSLVLVGAASGTVALAGGRVVTALLGHAYAGKVGTELGRLVAYLAIWMIAWAAFSITYPMLFVMYRTRLLIPLALATIGVDIPISIAARAWGGLTGVAVALGISTLLMVLGLMATLAPRMLWLSVVGLGRLALIVGASTALAFGGASLLLPVVPAVALGLVVYALLLVAVRQLGLAEAWHYVRALH